MRKHVDGFRTWLNQSSRRMLQVRASSTYSMSQVSESHRDDFKI